MNSDANLLVTGGGTPLARATNPVATVWVSANAGSGKTYVLSRRVIRLLLDGARPSELLCLTFTKVAASEMANKVFEILGKWAQLDDGKLAGEIRDLTGKPASPDQTRRARQLFATALDTPGGLRIQTIHAFCEALLHQFPIEANIPAHFELADDTNQMMLMGEARRRVMLAGLGMATGTEEKVKRLSAAFATLHRHSSDATIDKTLDEIVNQRDAFLAWIEDGEGSVETAFARVRALFNLTAETTPDDLYTSFRAETTYDASELQRLVEALRQSNGTTAQGFLELIETYRASPSDKESHEKRRALFLVGDNKDKPRKELISTKFMVGNNLFPSFVREQKILVSQIERMKQFEALEASEALFEVAFAMLTEYGNLKQRRGLLDFSDLISKTANLLSRSEIAAWVQYKLDAGIRHVLVDEAQDTSPIQWEIIRRITEEFYAGKGAREAVRTLFVVGDEKQSIYSFQGADPEEFGKQFRAILGKARDADMARDKVPLTISYRSTDEILSAVDAVFSLPEHQRGLSSNGEGFSHTANRQDQRGEVLIWPLEIKQTQPQKEDWIAPIDSLGEKVAEVRLANRIADTIRGWLDSGETLPARTRPIREGDILILVRKRDRFVKAMNLALKSRGLNAAGADRLKLTEHIAVEDMIALGRFASNALDDLSLAGLLKSPLFGMDESGLMDIAAGRGKTSLYEAICQRAEGDRNFADIREVLDEIAALADSVPVHEFYSQLFARHGLRAKYLARLGSEVEDILDGFFQSLLDYDNRNGLGLRGFVEWLAEASPELKREIEMESDEIRVITAHSSKGLEKPIVFLVDPGSKAFNPGHHAPKLVWNEHEGGEPYPLWQSKKEWQLEASRNANALIVEKAEDEYRRLLYVGMTRAADRLIVCGYASENVKHEHWHSMVLKALANPANEDCKGRLVAVEDREGRLIQHEWKIEGIRNKKAEEEQKDSAVRKQVSGLPQWLSPARAEKPVPRPLSPSGVLAMLDILPREGPVFTGVQVNALERGNLTHQLLQALPSLDISARMPFAEEWLGVQVRMLSAGERRKVLQDVQLVLDNPRLADLFGEHSQSEAEIAGTLTLGGKARWIRGRIDRLAVVGDRVLIADYKTNISVPASPGDVPVQYLAQMALYRALLQDIYRGHEISALLVWTQDGSVMELPDALLDAQMELLNTV